MADPVTFALVLLFALQAKHLFADFYLQTPKMLANRGVYLNFGRLQHALVHGVGTVLVLLLCGVSFGTVVLVAVIEVAVHFHIDWGKGLWTDHKQHGPQHASYWRAFGFDQALHQWTYLVMAWVLIP